MNDARYNDSGSTPVYSMRDGCLQQVGFVGGSQEGTEISLYSKIFETGDLSSLGDVETEDGVPILRVSLFGGFGLARERAPFDMTALNRAKVKNLLSILTLCPGRDLDCTHVARVLWPNGFEEKNRHNFYNLWALLRQGLALPDGECPYLIRRQNSCRVAENLVVSDVVVMDRLCTQLQFECSTVDEILETYRKIERLYAGDLLPGEDANGIITRKRWEWRNRLVDALMIGSCCLYFAGEFHPALWLAQTATLVDPSREDVCVVLMQAYMAIGAKSAAINAFGNLAKCIREEVAVNPSEQVTDYYNAILLEDYEMQEQIVEKQRRMTGCSPMRSSQMGSVPGIYRRADVGLYDGSTFDFHFADEFEGEADE